MPIYEYQCNNCNRRVTLFVRKSSPEARCTWCGSDDLARLISRFAVLRSEEMRLQDLDELGDYVDDTDPQSLAKAAREMQQALGEPPNPKFQEWVERMEGGEMPEEMEQALRREIPDELMGEE